MRRQPLRRRILIADRVELSARALEFLTASIRRDRRRRGRAVTILSALLVLAVGLAAFAFDRQRAAEDRQLLATARQLLAQAEARLDEDPRTALRLNEAAIYIHDSPETRAALVNNVLTTPYTGTLAAHDGGVRAVAFAPDEPLLASAGDDSMVRLWSLSDPAAPAPLGSVSAQAGRIWDVAFAPDDPLLASAGDDGTVRLWSLSDPATPTPLGFVPAHAGGASAVAFTPAGYVLASAGGDGTVRLWDIAGLIKLRDHAMEHACSITGGGPSRGEWRSFVPGIQYVDVCET